MIDTTRQQHFVGPERGLRVFFNLFGAAKVGCNRRAPVNSDVQRQLDHFFFEEL